MAGGNGNKSKMARERNLKNAPKEAKSTLNDSYKTAIVCQVCFQTFAQTSRKPELETHWENKHSKKELLDCFSEEILNK